MGGRKQKKRELNSGIYIIGEGPTERYYFSHIKNLFNIRCCINRRFFDNTCIADIEKKIKELLRDDIFIICVFDTDVSARNEREHERLKQLQNKYKDHKNLLFCDSFPSIEYWFLLHYEQTYRHFSTSKEVEKALKKHMTDYTKTSKFLEKDKWVRDLCAEEKLEQAIKRANCSKSSGSYSNMYKAFDILLKT
jgi:hypothetical protein